MKDTCCKEDCKWWKKYRDKCPFYLETTWTCDESGGTKLVCDCSPKRTLMLTMEMYNRSLGVQQAAEQARNESYRLSGEIKGAFHKLDTYYAPAIEMEDEDDIPKLSNS